MHGHKFTFLYTCIFQQDGLHWGVSSWNAVRKLADVLVNEALPTAFFSKTAPLPLWHWRFDATFRRYYPCCMKCNRITFDKHLESKKHHRNTAGFLLTFDFPGRAHHCAHGVVLRVGGRSDGEVETTLILPADHPLTGGSDFLPVGECAKVSNFHILTECGHKKAKNTYLYEQLLCRIEWADQPAIEDVFEIFSHGAKRDVLGRPTGN